MKVSQIHLSNFKRFDDLLVQNIPDTSKLVLLIGSNGSGKSSIFDAFHFFENIIRGVITDNSEHRNYCRKKKDLVASVKILFNNDFEYTVSDEVSNTFIPSYPLPLGSFYGRTSFRQIPRLTRTALGQGDDIDFKTESDRPQFFIDRDNRFENDIEKITETILAEFFATTTSNEQIKDKYIVPINKSLENIFGDKNGTKLQLVRIIPPLEGKVAQIIFQKGTSEIHYNFLSAGEKEVFNLIINLLSRATLYQDTIYYFDELDLHLNSKIQFNLLREITENWIPENCQLWTATHSLGFIKYANESDIATIIDFDDLDFDVPRILSPEAKDNPDIYEIVVGREFLPSLFQQLDVYFVENNDSNYYSVVGIPKAVFVKANNRNNVYFRALHNKVKGIIDRDFLSDSDILEIKNQYKNLIILRYYSIENYFYHPDNLEEYYLKIEKDFDKKLYMSQLTEAKNEIIKRFIPNLTLKRTEYPYFSEPVQNGSPLQNRFKNKHENEIESITIVEYLESNDFETFYKCLPMKDYCTHLIQRQNISKTELAKTKWFKLQLESLLISVSQK